MRFFVFLAGVLLAMEAAQAQESFREVPASTEFWMKRDGALDVSSNGLKNCWRWYERSGQPKQLVHFNHKGEGSIISLRGWQRPELHIVEGQLYAFYKARTFRFSPQWEEREVSEFALLPVTREHINLWGGRYFCTIPEFVATSSTRREMTTQWVEQVRETFSEDVSTESQNVEVPGATSPALPILPPPAAPTPTPDPGSDGTSTPKPPVREKVARV